MLKKYQILSLLITFHFAVIATPIDSSLFEQGIPPRIIRTCCAFGDNIKYIAIPFISHSDLIDPAEISAHKYMGHNNENNGIVYTRRGGFIDLGHLRDQADWTAYLQTLILKHKGKGACTLVLGHEAGKKTLHFDIPRDITNADAAQLAGKITYDLSVWHEIATWYGASTVPLIPERYSSFSTEDDYSNRLGIALGIKALNSPLSYEQAMSQLLDQELKELQMVETYDENLRAMQMTEGLWWSKKYRLPNKKIIINHQMSHYMCTTPVLIPHFDSNKYQAQELDIPHFDAQLTPLNNYYQLKIKLNGKIPHHKLFNDRKKSRFISNNDFPFLLNQITREVSSIRYRKIN